MTTKIKIPGLELDNPIIPASGTFGFGYEYLRFYDINVLGSICIKSATLEPRFGNPRTRVAESQGGMLNAIGLQNPGVDSIIKDELSVLKAVYNKKIIANIAGSTKEDYIECAMKMDQQEIVGVLEINVSCPNVKEGGMAFGIDKDVLFDLIKTIKEKVSKPVYVKLSPNVSDIVSIAKAAQDAGADGLVMINTLGAMRIDVHTRKPILANTFGGLSGGAIKPIALKMIYQVYSEVDIPIIGCGGIENTYDVIEMMMAGASAVEIGSANLINPFICKEIIEDLPNVMKELKIDKLEDIIGVAHE
ncbi:MAG: dihydroorotate dehydrogenase [Erysipelotrichales bacterium]